MEKGRDQSQQGPPTVYRRESNLWHDIRSHPAQKKQGPMLPLRVKIENQWTEERSRVGWEEGECLIKDACSPTRKTKNESHNLSESTSKVRSTFHTSFSTLISFYSHENKQLQSILVPVQLTFPALPCPHMPLLFAMAPQHPILLFH